MIDTTQYVVGKLLYVVSGHGRTDRELAGVGCVLRADAGEWIARLELG